MGSGSGDISLRLQKLAQQTRDELGDSATVEVVKGDTTYRVWEEFKRQHPDLPVPSNDGGTVKPREFSFLPDEQKIDAEFEAKLLAAVPASAPEAVDESEEAGAVEEAENDEAAEAPDAEDEAAENTEENPAAGKYAGENKPASTANWADLNGKNFEVIDEPDENGDIPTRPIHGEIKVEGEAKNGENPAKFTITDSDNGGVYTFELDTSVKDKVVYRCVSGPEGPYSKGNDYELRTINGKPILVQMKASEGHGMGVARVNAAAAAAEEEEEVEEAEEGEDNVEETSQMTPEQREAKIKEESEAILTDEALPDDAKTLLLAANMTLAAAAYSDPKPEISEDEDGNEVATLPDGRRIKIRRDENGEIIQVAIDNDTDGKACDVNYQKTQVSYEANPETRKYGKTLDVKYYNFDKILELAKRIFGEKK